MPQLDVTFFPTQIFWLIFTFIPLYLIIWRIVAPRISDTLEGRQKRIEDNLARAAKYKEEAEAANAAYEACLSEARANAAQIIYDAKLKLADELNTRDEEISQRLDSLILDNDVQIQNAVTNALDSIHSIAEEITAITTKILLNQAVDPTILNVAVKNAMNRKG